MSDEINSHKVLMEKKVENERIWKLEWICMNNAVLNDFSGRSGWAA
jgi:hypothetical protein